ncbi:hypothetical protein BWQ96_00922 [Gracilariopsis chorda]|uniref:Radical S-adenosyl methionine domain-containing protein 1, mitochondrial n=1 Tax=Gracilariopsis chorda TaxID=448386 RepID=A0A2V3J4J6_9FLOR|nr:hypothetical protein BWQ96_00922 [Gracilariopsis chorda]|eukprot:PXF49348.1 hypothetical protein BWQ96_00922 [Gracilariopsis chorda]
MGVARIASAFSLPPPSPMPSSLYIHLPFCLQRCAYCAFPVIVTPQVPANRPPPLQTSYIHLLKREINSFFALYNRALPPLQTLYLGGGTPSLLHPALLDSLLDTLRRHVSFAPDIEFTCEMDPATFTDAHARHFAQAGVNRASVGAQTFDPHLLKLTRRIHTPSDIATALSSLRKASISNISLDLIAGLPHQTLQTWRNTLQQALQLQPQHMSIYDLTLEQGTPFARSYTSAKHPLPDEHSSVQMLTDAVEMLSTHGYQHYEISNFARAHQAHDFRSRHNLAYWRNDPFFAFGLGATSLVHHVRFARPRLLGQYRNYVNNLYQCTQQTSDLDPQQRLLRAAFPGARVQNPTECLEDYLINRFRLLSEGVDFCHLRNMFGHVVERRLRNAVKQCNHFVEDRLLLVETDGLGRDVLRLSEQGALLENSIVSDLLWHAVWKFVDESATEEKLQKQPV